MIRRVTLVAALLSVLLSLPIFLSASETQIALFPFEDKSRQPSLGWIKESFVETFSEYLEGQSLKIIDRTERLAAQDRMGLPHDISLTRATMIRLGLDLDASHTVFGNFSKESGEWLIAEARVLNLSEKRIEAEFSERGPLNELRSLQTHLAWQVLRHFDAEAAGRVDEFIQRHKPIPFGAFENYVRGMLEVDRKAQLRYFLKAARMHPDYAKANFQIGKIYFDEKDYRTALLWLKKVPPEDGQYYAANFYIGLAQFFTGAYDKAVTTFSQIVEDLPLAVVQNNLAASLARLSPGQNGRAGELFRQAADSDIEEADFAFNAGYYAWRQRDYTGAVRWLRRAVERNPSDGESYYFLAQSLAALRRQPESEPMFQLAVRYSPKTSSWRNSTTLPRLERVKTRLDEKLFREMFAQIDELQEQKWARWPKSRHAASHVEHAKQHWQAGRKKEAMRELNHAVELDPNSPWAHYSLGRMYLALGAHERALSELKTAAWLKADPQIHVALAETYLAAAHHDEAQRELQAALALDPHFAEAKRLQARLHEKSVPQKKE